MSTAKKVVIFTVILVAFVAPMILYDVGLLILWKAGALSLFILMFLGGIMMAHRYSHNQRALAMIDLILGGGMAFSYLMAALIDGFATGFDYASVLMISTGLSVFFYGLHQLRKIRNTAAPYSVRALSN